MHAFNFLSAIGLLAALQVVVTWADDRFHENLAQIGDEHNIVRRNVQPADSNMLKTPVLVSYSDQRQIVEEHNNVRRNVEPTASNMLKMSWSDEAAANAQRWADGCKLDHSPDTSRIISTSGCGENLYMSHNQVSWKDAIKLWYDEVKGYRYGKGAINGAMIGHYTQLVWYNSNKVGCAMAYCPYAAYPYFYVCQYCPPGNSQYTHPYKSGPSCGDCPHACDDKLCTNPCPYADQYSNCQELKEQWGCSNKDVASWCPASCKCTTEII